MQCYSSPLYTVFPTLGLFRFPLPGVTLAYLEKIIAMVVQINPNIIFEYEIEDRVGKTDILRTVKVTIAWKKIVMVRHSFTHSLFF